MKCLGLEGPIIDTVIDGCTAVIQSGREPPEKLATAFDNRGVAYRHKGEYERALQDYEQAIDLIRATLTLTTIVGSFIGSKANMVAQLQTTMKQFG